MDLPARGALTIGAALALAAASAGAVHADAVDDLRDAVLPFRGIGQADVRSYRVELTLPEEDEDTVPLVEVWRAPADYGLRAANRAPRAIVRSWAIFLEPLYVARASLLDADFETGAGRLREIAAVETTPGDGGGRRIRVTLPTPADSLLPSFLRDVSSLVADLDARGRLRGFRLELRAAPGRRAETLDLACAWGDPRATQPSACTWTLPDGGEVRVTTTFRDEGGRRVPGGRRVVFPSRYDPGETEEIRIEYGTYQLDPEPDPFAAPGTFRYDANGLVAD